MYIVFFILIFVFHFYMMKKWGAKNYAEYSDPSFPLWRKIVSSSYIQLNGKHQWRKFSAYQAFIWIFYLLLIILFKIILNWF